MLVINAGTREKDFNWVRDNTRQFKCRLEHLSDDFTQIAIQGPKAVDLLQKLTDVDLNTDDEKIRVFGKGQRERTVMLTSATESIRLLRRIR